MFGRDVRLIGSLLLATSSATFAACGGADEAPLALRIAHRSLSSGITRARIDLHPGDRTCEEIARTGARLRASYRAEIDLTGLGVTETGEGEITGIRGGAYTVVVWGFVGIETRARAFGCTEAVQVKDGERADVHIDLTAI